MAIFDLAFDIFMQNYRKNIYFTKLCYVSFYHKNPPQRLYKHSLFHLFIKKPFSSKYFPNYSKTNYLYIFLGEYIFKLQGKIILYLKIAMCNILFQKIEYVK